MTAKTTKKKTKPEAPRKPRPKANEPKAYRYRAYLLSDPREHFDPALRQRHDYLNDLRRLELIRRHAYDRICERLSPGYARSKRDLAAAKKALDQLEAEAKAFRAGRSHARLPGPLNDSLRDARAAVKDAREAQKAAAAALADHPDHARWLGDAEDEAQGTRRPKFTPAGRLPARPRERVTPPGILNACAGRRARLLRERHGLAGLSSHNRGAVEAGAKGFRKGPPPRPCRHDRTGSVSVQFKRNAGEPPFTFAGALGEGPPPRTPACPGDRPECSRNECRACEAHAALVRRDHACMEAWRKLFRATPVPNRPCGPACRGNCRQCRLKRYDVEMLVRPEGGGRPAAYVRARVVLHRPVPPGCVIKWAHLDRARVGTHDEYTLRLNLDRERGDPWPCRHQRPDSGSVKVRLRPPEHRALPDGSLLVATWEGSDGGSGAIVLPARTPAGNPGVQMRFERADYLRCVRDKMLPDALAGVVAYWRGVVAGGGTLPGWLTDLLWRRPRRGPRLGVGQQMRRPNAARLLATLAQWRSAARLARLVVVWGENRHPGDEGAFRELDRTVSDAEAKHPDRTSRRDADPSAIQETEEGFSRAGWRPKDKHLYDWQAYSSAKAARQRSHAYREAVRLLAGRYGECEVSKEDLAELKKRPAVEECVVRTAARREACRSRDRCAPGTLRRYLKEAFGERCKDLLGKDDAKPCVTA